MNQMFRYVSKLVETRIRDTYNLGINVRKSFNVTQQQQKSHEENDPKLSYSVVPRHQDPSRDKDKSDEKFKKKYSRLNNNRCILNAWIWVGLALKFVLNIFRNYFFFFFNSQRL